MVTGTIGTRRVFRCDLPQIPLDLLHDALRRYGNSVVFSIEAPLVKGSKLSQHEHRDQGYCPLW